MKRGNKRKFGRTSKQRNALLNSLAAALIEHGRITTTRAKAKSLSSYINGLISKAKSPSISVRRYLASSLHSKIIKLLTDEISPKLSGQGGGYTRITNLPRRKSDGAEMSIIEFTL